VQWSLLVLNRWGLNRVVCRASPIMEPDRAEVIQRIRLIAGQMEQAVLTYRE